MKSEKVKIYLFIDGSNLYAGQFELFGPAKYLDFSLFVKQIENKLKLIFQKIYFYASYSPKPNNPSFKQKQYLRNEAFFYKSVRETPNIIFFKGYRSKTSGKEKDVDVKLAVDIVDFAHRKYYDQIYLISGDADFMEALFCVRRLGKKIGIFCLENKVMFKSFAFFDTYLLILQHTPLLKLPHKMKRNYHKIIIERKNVVVSI